MKLNQLKPAPGSRTPKRIVGRGEGSTLGQTCGKGQKGQTCRSGDGIMNGFEGGQTPLMRRLPKRGFTHASKVRYTAINVETLEKKFESGSEINASVLFQHGLIKHNNDPFKILGDGKVTKSFKITAPKFSKSAEKAVNAAGGRLSAAPQ